MINDNIYESKNYFIPKESGIYHIKIFIKNIVQDCFGLFYECRKITKINLFFFDTKNVTINNMRYMFYKCSNLTKIDLSSFDTKNVANMGYVLSLF